ncbi:MAG: peptidase S41 [Flavobacteriaceae bacterium]|nr:MAG: peptidase S41 [Flavobacteriaceae bacterium]
MNKLFSLLASILVTTTVVFSQENPLINTPSLSPDGSVIAFNYQGDIWTVETNGQNLKRLTIHEANDANPHWSADGKTIAFNSDRFGNNDVFTISSNGGLPHRITYHSASDKVTDFTKNNEIYFTTARNFVQVEREAEIHHISEKGGTPFRLLDAVGFDATLSPNGKFIAFTRGTCRVEREAYQGPANRDLWLYNNDTKSYRQLTAFDGQDLAPQWADDSTIVFQSARSGVYNVHQLQIDANGNKTGEISQITSLKKMGLWSFDLSTNGKDLVVVSGDKISLVNRNTKSAKPLKITIGSDYRFDPQERKTFSNNATEIEVSPNGKLSAFVVRGEVFITENDTKKSRTINLTNSPSRDLDIIWLNDETLLFKSDRNGSNNLYTVSSNDPENENIFTSLKHNIVQITKSKAGISNPTLAPNGTSIVYKEGNGKLITATISETGKVSNQKTLIDSWDSAEGLAWSPDSKWLAYSLSDLNFNDEIYIHKADGSKDPINISMHPKGDYSPTWSADGKKLGFSSNRNNGDFDVWFVWLNKKDWEKTKEDWDEEVDEKKAKKDEKSDDKKEDEIVDVIIDFEDIHERQVQVTSFTGGESIEAISKDGKTFYYTTGNGTRGNPKVENDLFKIAWDGKDRKALTSGNARPRQVSLDLKEKYIYHISKGKLARIKTSDSKKESLPFSAKMIIDYTAESNQIFDEAWNVIEDRFYDPNHHGRDWDKLKNTYKPLALKASTRTDFKVVFNKMLGQINASHMGLYRGENRADTQNEQTGILGIELENANGNLKISAIVPNSAADRETSKLIVGDIIKSVNGEEVSTSENMYKHLAATTNEKIVLEVTRNGAEREVVIRPKSSARTDNYKAWVKERKRLTEKYSNGRLGYIHIQGMNWTSFERFERELTAAGLGKEGIVIDVRFNGGGWTTDYLMAVLNVQQHAYTVPRGAAKNLEKEHTNFSKYYPFSERLPLASWTKPSIALCNQNSYSNAEIFSHAYKELNLGKLVGVPTFGAVISTGGHTLIDGSYVRVPFRGWYVKSSQKNMDFTPAMPDVVVYNNPDDKAKGKDTQLKKAVDELLKDL